MTALPTPRIDADFPGGNILQDGRDGDTLFLRQDLRDTEGHWFWWYFRARDCAGCRLLFSFTDGCVVGHRGPAVSRDGGRTWEWLGRDSVVRTEKGFAFEARFPDDAEDTRFAFSIPYVESDLLRFATARDGALRIEELCRSRHGRSVQLLRAGPAGGTAARRLLLTARHHACESIASFVLEGILEAATGPGPTARLLRRTEILAVPFVDKAGVEAGDQGKNRRPHDHNRDYVDNAIYPETIALRNLVLGDSVANPFAALDLHCPYMSGDLSRLVYVVGSAHGPNAVAQRILCDALETLRSGPWPFRAHDYLPFGTGWNTGKNYGAGVPAGRWFASCPNCLLSATVEISYADMRGVPVTPENARAFGRDLARALALSLPSAC